ncbi:hypothetical protein PLESTB_001464500 [Pleodorina starrii]|uniref:Uncharacterized protein n=1 Tax=Pleodorina starrii TaxID=330485 RepID=A0A9W6BVH1_9CHLO|nr:hypothetical protein PLESTM_001682600 [Pleodorina starrii]GLC59231.1 hypothetical protein PLESTB_001464500 [Pleodorina starrii]GLC74795.1 hypothetical protein PLESTF_001557000 [Pleodorina starrii]
MIMSSCAWRSHCGASRSVPAASSRPCRALVTVAAAHSCNKAATSSNGASRRAVLLSGLGLIAAPHFLMPGEVSAVAVDAALEEYERLELEGKLNSAKAYDNIRTKLNFKRGLDGRVYVKNAKGKLFAVRLDMESPGTMLIRDTDSGEVYGLQTEGFQQIDLTNDAVVIALFADGNWESAMSPITFEDDDGKVKTLKLDEKLFRNLPGLLSATGEQGEE